MNADHEYNHPPYIEELPSGVCILRYESGDSGGYDVTEYALVFDSKQDLIDFLFREEK